MAAVDLGVAVMPDRAVASALAARHLERVLARGPNRRLIAALPNLARELAPPRARPARSSGQAATWATGHLAIGR